MLRVIATDLDPETIKPKRLYRRDSYLARNELSRLCFGALRTAVGELLSTDDSTINKPKGFTEAERLALGLVGLVLDVMETIETQLATEQLIKSSNMCTILRGWFNRSRFVNLRG